MTKKLFVRFSTAADEKAIFDFYAENQHEFVARRDPKVWKTRIDAGACTVIQDEDGKIVAAAIAYPMTRPTPEGDVHAWTEIGSVCVTASMKGMGLFDHLLSAHVLRASLLEPPEDCFLMEIVSKNAHSKHVFLKAGAEPFDASPEIRAQAQATFSPDELLTVDDWFQMGVALVPKFAGKVLDAADNPKIVSKITKEEFELDYSRCVLITAFRDILEDAAGRNPAHAVKPAANDGVKSFRKKFHP